jgi:uncharacterized membrane protein YfcA
MGPQIAILASLTAFASAVGSITGFGTSTIMVPILLVMGFPLAETLLFAAVIHWMDDVWKMGLFREGRRWRAVALFGATGIVASVAGATMTRAFPEAALARVLGAFLLAYVAFIFARPRWRLKQTPANEVIGGAASGFVAGIFGIGGAVRSAFLSAFDLRKSVFIFTSAAIAFAIDSARIVTYLAGGSRLGGPLLAGMAAYVAASLAGTWLGKRVVDRIPQSWFRPVVAAFLGLAGLKLIAGI